jgi:hypothetical protein
MTFCSVRAVCLGLAALCLTLWSCGDDSPTGGDDNTPTPTTSTYLSMGNAGGLVEYTLSSDHSYSYVDMTTGDTVRGVFTVSSDPNTQGVLVTTVGATTHYALELANGMFVTTIPSGTAGNQLVVGLACGDGPVLSKQLAAGAATYTPAELAGDYFWIFFGNQWSDLLAGGYRMNANLTYTWNVVAETVDPASPTFSFSDYVEGMGAGTWAQHPSIPAALSFHETMFEPSTATGIVAPGKAMLIQDAAGFSLGLRYPDAFVTQSQLAGTYNFIDLADNGDVGIGRYTIPATGTTVSWWERIGGQDQSGTSTGFTLYPRFYGVGSIEDEFDGDVFKTTMVLIPGGALMHFCLKTSTGGSPELISYGVGVRMP